MCFDCSLPLWSSGVLRNAHRGEAQNKESCGGDGPRPAGAAAAGDLMANEKKNKRKKKGLHIARRGKYDLLDDNKFSGTGWCQKIQVGGSISVGAESVCAF